MASYIYNQLKIIGSDKQIKIIQEHLKKKTPDKDGNNYIDFNNIIKMPECLSVKECNHGNLGRLIIFGVPNSKKSENIKEALEEFSQLSTDKRKEAVELALKYQANFEATGHSTWYSWCYENWETKWNAFDQSLPEDNTIIFYTAGAPVYKLIATLSKSFPQVKIEYYFDSYGDYKWGKALFQGSDVLNYEEGELEIDF